MPRPPLADRYWVTLLIVLLALSPDIVVTTAYRLLVPHLGSDLQTSRTTLMVADGLSDAAYAFGAIVGGYVTKRFPQRRLFLLFEAVFTLGCALAAGASDGWSFSAGRVLQGLATGLLLVVAIPPLSQRFSVAHMPTTAAGINIGFFGAVTVGPLIGGAVAAGHAWRWFFAVLAVAGALTLVLAVATLPHTDPPEPTRPVPWTMLTLAALGTGLPFFGVARLTAAAWSDPVFWAPLAGGLCLLVVLVVSEYRRQDAFVPVHAMASGLPLAGTLGAMVGGAAYVALLDLSLGFLERGLGFSPLRAGLALWPQVVALLAVALLFWRLFCTRHVPLLVVSGMVLLVAAAGLMTTVGTDGSDATVLAVAALLGAGAGATVSPALWLAALALPLQQIGSVFALIELVRSEADFLVGPVLGHAARSHGGGVPTGVHFASWVTLAITVAGTVGMVAAYRARQARPQRPDLEAWHERGEVALAA